MTLSPISSSDRINGYIDSDSSTDISDFSSFSFDPVSSSTSPDRLASYSSSESFNPYPIVEMDDDNESIEAGMSTSSSNTLTTSASDGSCSDTSIPSSSTQNSSRRSTPVLQVGVIEERYIPPTKSEFNRKEAYLKKHLSSETRMELYSVFDRGQVGTQAPTRWYEWSTEVSHLLVSHFTPSAFRPLGDGVIHRDAKLSNAILLPDGKVQWIDPGTATFFAGMKRDPYGDWKVHPYEGFALDALPSTSDKTDTYGVFRIAYNLLAGRDFFHNAKSISQFRDRQYRMRAIESRTPLQAFFSEDRALRGASLHLIDLMARTGTTYKDRRLTATQALSHPFFASKQVAPIETAA
ncbi:protein kinase domain-containing protein [Simkania sp.]|uniref:protein kinase domain-containing protein n=1 Tax=Simkania sp. TaxID=34094 RepID=UPI003B5233B6